MKTFTVDDLVPRHPSLVVIDPQDWVDPHVVDARDTADPLRLAALVVVQAHVGVGTSACSQAHSPECERITALLGFDDFPALLNGLGIDAGPDLRRRRTPPGTFRRENGGSHRGDASRYPNADRTTDGRHR